MTACDKTAMLSFSQLGEYQKVQPTVFPPRVLRETAEGKFWRKFKSPLSEC